MKNRMLRYFDKEPVEKSVQQAQSAPPFQIIDKLLQSFFGGSPVRTIQPAITEIVEEYQICVSLPNILANDLNITVENRDLILKIRKKSGNSLSIITHRWTLPKDARLNYINADVKDGLLTITVPRYQSNQFKVDINYN